MFPRITARYALVAVLVASASVVQAEVALPPFFSDHMVLQRETKAPIWGTAAPGEEVTVHFRDQNLKAKADEAGEWRVELKGLKAGGPDELTITGTNTLKFTDVLVGEVWVGSGQSNMAGLVRTYVGNDPVLAQLAATAHPTIRGCTAKTGWTVSSPAANANFSAILFAFAVRLQEGIDVPVGMMLGAVGGTPSGAWVSNERFQEAPPAGLVASMQTFDKQLADFNDRAPGRKGPRQRKPRASRRPQPLPPRGGTINESPGTYEATFVRCGIVGQRRIAAVNSVDQYHDERFAAAGGGTGNSILYVQKPSGGGCAGLEQPVTRKRFNNSRKRNSPRRSTARRSTAPTWRTMCAS
jgi:sialate O-acetylesterase